MKSNSLARFTTTYILFFLCVAVLLLPLYSKILAMFTEKTVNDSYNYLKSGVDNLENDLNNISVLVQSIYSTPEIKKLAYMNEELTPSDYTTIIKAQTRFEQFIIPIRIISDCGIVFSNGIIFTPDRIFFGNEAFYDSYYKCGEMEYSEWYDTLRTTAVSRSFIECRNMSTQKFGSYEAVTFTTTLPLYSKYYIEGLFYTTISKEYILSVLASSEIIENGFMYIKDRNDNMLLNFNYDGKTQDMHIVEYAGPNIGITVTAGIPGSVFSKKIKPIKNMIIFYSSILIALGIALSIIFAHKNSKPVRDIVNMLNNSIRIRSNTDGSINITGINDFAYISESLKHMDSTLEEFEDDLTEQKRLIRSNLFERLIRGLVYTETEFEEVRNYFPQFPQNYSLALIEIIEPCTGHTSDLVYSAAKQVMLLSIFDKHLNDETLIHFTEGTSIVLMLPAPDDHENHREHYRDILLNIKSDFRQQYGMNTVVAVSELFSNPENLSKAFNQTKNMIRLIGHDDINNIWHLDDFPESASRMAIGYNDMQRLYEVLMAGEKENALYMVDRFAQVIHTSGFVNEMYIEQLFYDIRGVLLRIKQELFETGMASLEIPSYRSKADVRSMLDSIKECCMYICNFIEKRSKEKSANYASTIIKYIGDNLDNQDLYIKSVADHYKISESYIQKIIKTSTGKSFFDYLENIRLEKAMELLELSSLSINEIAEKSGFSSQNSFYKAFKRRYGMSPSSMRDYKKSCALHS